YPEGHRQPFTWRGLDRVLALGRACHGGDVARAPVAIDQFDPVFGLGEGVFSQNRLHGVVQRALGQIGKRDGGGSAGAVAVVRLPAADSDAAVTLEAENLGQLALVEAQGGADFADLLRAQRASHMATASRRTSRRSMVE